MSTKRDPVIAVLKYFQEAELVLARQALALAQQTLRARTPPGRPLVVKKKTVPVAAVGGSRGE